MSDIKRLNAYLDKFIIENVLSGDFMKSKFKEKLVTFLDFVSSHYSAVTDYSRAIVLETIEKKVRSLERTSHPSFMTNRNPEPKQHRVWISCFYAHLILERDFCSQQEVAVWVSQAFPNLIAETKYIEEAWSILSKFKARRSPRKRPLQGAEIDQPPAKRQKLAVGEVSHESHDSGASHEEEAEADDRQNLTNESPPAAGTEEDRDTTGATQSMNNLSLEAPPTARRVTKSGRLSVPPKVFDVDVQPLDDFEGNGDEDEEDVIRNAVHSSGSSEDEETPEIMERALPSLESSHEESEDEDYDNTNPKKSKIDKTAAHIKELIECFVTKTKEVPKAPRSELIKMCLSYLHASKTSLVIQNKMVTQIISQHVIVDLEDQQQVLVIMEDDESSTDDNEEVQTCSEKKKENKSKDSQKNKKKSSKKSQKKKKSSKKGKKSRKSKKSDKSESQKDKPEDEKSSDDEEDQDLEETSSQTLRVALQGLKVHENTVPFMVFMHEAEIDKEYFDSFTKEFKERRHFEFRFKDVDTDYSPNLFFRCWYDPMLSGLDKAAVMESFAKTSASNAQLVRRFRTMTKVNYFILGTLLESWSINLQAELVSTSSLGDSIGQLTQRVNELLLAKLIVLPAYQQMISSGIFPRSFETASNPKQAFRSLKSDMLKFVALCRLMPAVLFMSSSFNTLLKICPPIEDFKKDLVAIAGHSTIPTFYDERCLNQWPVQDTPAYLL